jgi:hypothetical protein
MGKAVILLEIGIFAVAFGIVVARRGYIGSHSRPYTSATHRLPLGVALILVGLGLIAVGIFIV